MPIRIDWGDYDKTLLIMSFNGRWTADEYYRAINDLYIYASERDHALELMVDVRHSVQPPQNLVTLIRSTLNQERAIAMDQVVVIVQSGFWQQIFSVARKVHGRELDTAVHFVESVDQAYSMLSAYKGYV